MDLNHARLPFRHTRVGAMVTERRTLANMDSSDVRNV